MGKHAEKVGSYEDFRAPWETEAGTDGEVDKGKLKRLVFDSRLTEAKLRDSRDEALEKVKAVEAERDEARSEVAKASPDEANKKIERLEKQNTELLAEKEARQKADEHAALRQEVIGDLEPKYAKYVTGEDRKALEESLETVKADFGLGEPGSDEEDEYEVRTRPQSGLQNGADPKLGKPGDPEIDFDKAADEILGKHIFS